MYLRNFGPTLAFLISSTMVLVWASSIVPPFPSSSSPTTTMLKMLQATWRRRHKGIFIMAAWQVLQTAADQNAVALARFIGIGEIHLLFGQQRAQMFVDLLERRVFEGFNGASLLSVVAFGQDRPVFDDLDAGELFENPPLRAIERDLGLFRFEALVHCHHAFELFGVGAGIEHHPFNQRQDRRWAV